MTHCQGLTVSVNNGPAGMEKNSDSGWNWVWVKLVALRFASVLTSAFELNGSRKLVMLCRVGAHIFCSTSLPLASTRWFCLTFSSLCPLFQAVQSINLSSIQKKFLGCRELNTGLVGEKQVCYLLAIQPTRGFTSLKNTQLLNGCTIMASLSWATWSS